MNDKKKRAVSVIIAAGVVLSGISFYAGTIYSKNGSQQAFPAEPFATGARSGARMVRNGGGMMAGEIIKKDETSITLKLRDGGSKIVFYGASTEILKQASGTPSDLTEGLSITASGTTNQDGSVTAKTIQIRPAIPTGFGGERPGEVQ